MTISDPIERYGVNVVQYDMLFCQNILAVVLLAKLVKFLYSSKGLAVLSKRKNRVRENPRIVWLFLIRIVLVPVLFSRPALNGVPLLSRAQRARVFMSFRMERVCAPYATRPCSRRYTGVCRMYSHGIHRVVKKRTGRFYVWNGNSSGRAKTMTIPIIICNGRPTFR